jgi:spore coat polysaccharide biosynthesis protein SpsF
VRVVVVIQARLGSTRLPGKVLMEIGGALALEHVVARSQAIVGVDGVVVATTDLTDDDAIADACAAHDIACFRGNEEDVLDRYYQVAREWKADHIVRVTADCPLVCPHEAARVVERQLTRGADCTHNLTIFGSEMPLGTGVEVFTFDTIAASWREGRSAHHREHVDEFVYEHPERFQIELVTAPVQLARPRYRLTVDTEEDLDLIRRIYDAVAPGPGGLVELRDVIALLDGRPDLVEINVHVQQKTT